MLLFFKRHKATYCLIFARILRGSVESSTPFKVFLLSFSSRDFPEGIGTMASDFIPLRGRSVDIVRRSREALSDVLRSKFGCVAVIEGVDFSHDFNIAHRGRPAVEHQPRFAGQLRGGVQVSVWKGDLTVFDKAEAVVNAANANLQHVGGLAAALSRAGGPAVKRESDLYINNHGPLNTGDAVITGPGMLPCKLIIHAVGPELNPGPSSPEVSRAEPFLMKAIWSILEKVKQNGLQSVAIPAISSGLFHYPLHLCATVIVSTVKEYFDNLNPHKHCPKEIFLVNNDEPTVMEMTRACQEIFSRQTSMTYSQATASMSRGDTKTTTQFLQIGNVHLKLMKGNIEEQETDVIVNTASESLNLDTGAISKALLRKAGPGLQQEIYNTTTKPLKGEVVITKAYKLHCKNVFHTFCSGESEDRAVQILSESVSKCLRLAQTKKHKSITFPAIGSGNLGFKGHAVAEIILSAVADFAKMSSVKLEVSVVIFPSDIDTFRAFEEKMKCLKEKVSGPSFEFASNSADDSRALKALSPRLILSSSSEVAKSEAQHWLQSILFNPSSFFIIRNNFILHFGELEYRQLTLLTQNGVRIEEFFDKGHAGIKVKEGLDEGIAVSALQVEAILCRTKREFVRAEEQELCKMLAKPVSSWRRISPSAQESQKRLRLFLSSGPRMIKVEKVENQLLEEIFEIKKTQLHCSTSRTMFQCIPAQFVEMVCSIGFHAEFAPPQEPEFGEGIYFTTTVEKAMEVWGWQKFDEKFVYIVEAEVLTGRSAPGKPGLILPPADPQTPYSSVSGGRDISVIFSGYQALPRFIFTCEVGNDTDSLL